MKRPQLKRPELKVPPVLADLYQDLRDRRLLPLLALVVVAIVAVPFVLGGGVEEGLESPPPATPSPSQLAENASLTVIEATPGLRDYRKRLRRRVATNPFKQRYTAPTLEGAELQDESSASSSLATSTSSTSAEPPSDGSSADGGSAPPVSETPSSPPPDGGAPGNNGAGQGGPPRDVRFYSWTVDIKIAHAKRNLDGSQTMGTPTTREGVRSLTPLPGEKAPVVTFMGVSPDTGNAIFMVSKDVTAVFGDTKCISGTDSCELLEVERGFPFTLTYGPAETRHKINVLEIDLVRAAGS